MGGDIYLRYFSPLGKSSTSLGREHLLTTGVAPCPVSNIGADELKNWMLSHAGGDSNRSEKLGGSAGDAGY